MKRLALALAAAVLGTACGTDCPSGTTLVSWNGFDGPAPGVVNVPCGPANVFYVDLWIDGQLVQRSPCADLGAAIPGVPAGGNVLDVEGIAGDGQTILFRDSLNYAQPGCDSVALQAFPGAGTVEVDYSFAPTNACASPPPTYMWLQVRDDITGQPALTDTGLTAAQVCSVTAPAPRYDLANGPYTLVGIQEMAPVGPSVLGADCTDHPFDIGSGQIAPVAPVLVNSTLACF